jgi:hypothetical protein
MEVKDSFGKFYQFLFGNCFGRIPVTMKNRHRNRAIRSNLFCSNRVVIANTIAATSPDFYREASKAKKDFHYYPLRG